MTPSAPVPSVADLPEAPTPPAQETFDVATLAAVARGDLGLYGELVHGFRPEPHQQLLCDAVTELVEGRLRGEDGEIKRRLLIIAPPGSAKSTWLSRIFPCHYLGNHPDENLLFFTASQTNTNLFHGVVADTLEANPKHAAVFPSPLCRPNKKRGWSTDGIFLQGAPSTEKDPSYRAVSWSESVPGIRAHGIIIDDPQDETSATSPLEQPKARDRFDNLIEPRLHPNGWILCVSTRWHESDLPGYFASQPDEWVVLTLPLLGDWPWDAAEPKGEQSLWPARFPASWCRRRRARIGGPRFSLIYNGDPTAMGGDVFRSDSWFRDLPDGFLTPDEHGFSPRDRLTKVQFWDTTFSLKAKQNDYTVGITLGVDAAKNLYVLDIVRARMTPHEQLVAMTKAAKRWNPVAIGIELAAFRKKEVEAQVRSLSRLVAAPIFPVPVQGDKVQRALLPAARAEAGMLFVDKALSQWPELHAELRGFPRKSTDDGVDALSGATLMAVGQVVHSSGGRRPARREYGVTIPGKTETRPWWLGDNVDPATGLTDSQKAAKLLEQLEAGAQPHQQKLRKVKAALGELERKVLLLLGEVEEEDAGSSFGAHDVHLRETPAA